MNQRNAAARAGMIGPALFVTVFTLEGWLRPGYDPFGMYVSELSLGPRGWIQIANFVVFGTLMLLFVRGVADEFHTGKGSRSGPLLLAVIAVSYLVSGPFVMDPTTVPADRMSWHGALHGIFGAIVFALMPVGCFVFLRRFREDAAWRPLFGWTLAAGTISATAVIMLSLATKLPVPPESFAAWEGAIQRTAIIPFQAWIFTFAVRLYRRINN
jgi:hypothetical protein